MGNKKHAYEALRRTSKVADHVSAMLAYWDIDLVCRYANAAYLEWFGKSAAELIDKLTLPELLGPLYQLNLPFINGALEGRPQTFERVIPTPKGTRYSLANYFPDIEDGNVKGFFVHVADITSVKLLEEELLRTNEVIKEQNRRLLNFANIVTHNLRTYCNNLQAITRMIEDARDDGDRKEPLRYLHMISDSFSATIRHLNEIVRYQNQVQLSPEAIELNAFIERITSILRKEIAEARADIHNEIDKRIVLHVNPAYLESVMLNLVSNAIKYRDPLKKPLIVIRCVKQQGQFVLSVADNGLGIDLQAYRDQLFGMYKTFHGNPDAEGIGLFITRFQVEAMGGTIDVESEPGKGTTFTIHLPATEHSAVYRSQLEEASVNAIPEET